MIQAWRIIKAKHAGQAFSGAGAKTYGGRWNTPGTTVVYTAGSVSLAILEMLVHLQANDLMRSYVIFEVTFDESLVKRVDSGSLPKRWRHFPPAASVQQVGDAWVAEGSSAVLALPSTIVPSEWNYVLNPLHPAFAKITIGSKQPLKFDPRLIKASVSP